MDEPTALKAEHRFPCHTCGSDLRFDPAEGLLKCDHCGNEEPMIEGRAGSIRELDFAAATQGQLAEQEMEETRVSACPNCAAQVEFDPNTHAAECPFCATPVVTDTGTHRHIKPRAVLPFALSERAAQKAMVDWHALAPWDLTALAPYTPEYLAGFRAEGYTIDLDTAFTEARARMDAQITRDIRFDIGGDKQRITSAKTQVSDVTFKHILLPVWMAAYKYRGKTYRFVVNGQTGAVKGERPYSAIKIALAVTLGLIVAAAIGYGMAITQ